MILFLDLQKPQAVAEGATNQEATVGEAVDQYIGLRLSGVDQTEESSGKLMDWLAALP